jgi:arabinose-5-phosphate isomerase
MTAATATNPEHLDVARSVLYTEAAGLHALAVGLTAGFAHAVELLARTTGRVVVSGMGKSGHVARKVATLASTGTAAPCSSIRPRPSHGDLA